MIARKGLVLLFAFVLVALVGVTAFASGEQEGESAPESETVTEELPRSPRGFAESPVLAEKVAANELPPVDDRLPVDPVVVTTGTILPAEYLEVEPGAYSEEFVAGRNNWGIMAEPLMYRPNFSLDLQPNIISDWDISSDLKTFTLRIREGIRWSDGEPVTTEDVRFVYEDVVLNEELTPTVPSFLQVGGAPGELSVVDDYTFMFTFEEPFAEFLIQIALAFENYTNLIRPSHYLKQFHSAYADEELLEQHLADASLGAGEWTTLFQQKDVASGGFFSPNAIGSPVLTPWITVKSESDQAILERNPYYFAVDEDGKQLPYFDRINSLAMGSGGEANETRNLMIIDRQIDYSWGGGADVTDLPFMMERQEQGNFKVVNFGSFSTYQIYPNFTYDDATWRDVLMDVRFRRALNYAIDKDYVNEVVHGGLAKVPRSVQGYLYDPDEANRLLDEMGMDARDSDGFRLAPNGESFEVFVQIPAVPVFANTLEIVKQNWEAVGVRTDFKQISWELTEQLAGANELQATIRWSREPVWDIRLEHDYLPRIYWAPLWREWYDSDGDQGEEPPETYKFLFDVYEGLIATVPGSDEGQQLTADLYAWFEENIPWFMVWEAGGLTHHFNNRIGNVPLAGAQHHASWQVRKIQFATGDR